MKPGEAIENLGIAVQAYHASGDSWNQSDYEMDEALNIAIAALEKQIPKKPTKRMKNPDGTDQFSCAVCGRLWWEKDFVTKFCDGCGTAVNREDEDEKKD